MKNFLYIGMLTFMVVVSFVVIGERRGELIPLGDTYNYCPEEPRMCPDGSYVERIPPQCVEYDPCPSYETEYESEGDMIHVYEPAPGQTVASPITVSGVARGNWFFEASFPVDVVNWDGLIIGQGYVTAQDDWMTTEFVPFTGTITYTIDPETPYTRGALIFKKDNPSGLPEYDAAYEMPITLVIPRNVTKPVDVTPVMPPKGGDNIACTMDARECPDGSWVGRVPPSCAFAPCPNTTE